MIHRLKHQGAGAVNALDWLCHVETMREILDAMTPQQLVVAALLAEGMTLKEIANEINEVGDDEVGDDEKGITITWQAVQDRNRKARERVARTMYHMNAEHLVGDVLSRNRWKKKEAA